MLSASLIIDIVFAFITYIALTAASTTPEDQLNYSSDSASSCRATNPLLTSLGSTVFRLSPSAAERKRYPRHNHQQHHSTRILSDSFENSYNQPGAIEFVLDLSSQPILRVIPNLISDLSFSSTTTPGVPVPKLLNCYSIPKHDATARFHPSNREHKLMKPNQVKQQQTQMITYICAIDSTVTSTEGISVNCGGTFIVYLFFKQSPTFALYRRYLTTCATGQFSIESSCYLCLLPCKECSISATLCTACESNKYLDAATSTCVNCHPYCTSCVTSGITCTGCVDGLYVDSNSICVSCTYPCKTCITSSTNCLSCPYRYYLSTSNTCEYCPDNCWICSDSSTCTTCASGFYVSTTNTCLPCDYTCYQCQTTASKCTQCYAGFYVTASYTCSICDSNCLQCYSTPTQCSQCASGYYLENFICKLCHTSCNICYNSTECYNCHSGYFLDATTKRCVQCPLNCSYCTSSTDCSSCSQGYYQSSNQCLQCSLSCLTCQSSTYCSSCAIGYYLQNRLCQVCTIGCTNCTSSNNCLSGYCADGYYQSGVSSYTCTICSTGCATCTSSSICVTCIAGYQLNSSNICDACGSNCLSCSSSSTCTTCEEGYFLTSSLECHACSLPCATCSTSATHCDSCFSEYNLSSNTCQRDCSICDSQYGCIQDTITMILPCQQCSTSCKTCSEVTINDCQTCQSTYTLAGNYQCTKCSTMYCEECDSLGTCQSCLSGYALTQQNLCIEINCLSNYYSDNGTCYVCPHGCSTCSSETNCTDCVPGMYLSTISSDVRCIACIGVCTACDVNTGDCLTCPDGYYINTTTSGEQCVRSPNPCYNYDKTSDVCTACEDGYYLLSGTCLTCLYPCYTCTSALVCQTCRSGYILDTTANTCVQCSWNCGTCSTTDRNVCLTCVSSRTLNTSTNRCECNDGYFELNYQYCYNCSSTCKTCDTYSQYCTSCYSWQYRTLQNWQCLCQPGYYSQMTYSNCQKCNDMCSECFGGRADQCLTCQNNMILDVQFYRCTCASGYYADSTNTCQACSSAMPGCAECSSATVCLLCDANMSLSSSSSSCECVSGYNMNSSNVCEECAVAFCSDCSADVNTCTACFSGQTTNTSTCLCDSSGLTGYSFDAHAGTCQLCHYSCLVCDGFSEHHCTSCSASDKRTLTSQNSCACDDGYYDDEVKSLCQACHFSCETCMGPYSTDCTKCRSGTYRSQYPEDMSTTETVTQFSCVCQDGYYDTYLSEVCSKCHYSCLTCAGDEKQCLICAANSYRFMTASGTCDCESGYYDDGSTALCGQCHGTCAECANADADGCLACVTNLNRVDTMPEDPTLATFRCECQKYYFSAGSDLKCYACDYSCEECNGTAGTDCTSCSSIAMYMRTLNILSTNANGVSSGTCDCPIGYQEKPPSHMCFGCPIHCETCDLVKQCVTCWNTRELVSGECVCEQGYYEVGDIECKECSHFCLTCDVTATNCTACDSSVTNRDFNIYTNTCDCIDGYFDASTYDATGAIVTEVLVCEQCVNNCKTCTSNAVGFCKTCYEDQYYVLLNNGECLCMFGYVANGNVCEKIPFEIANGQLDVSSSAEYADRIDFLLMVLKYASWSMIIFNQPFQSSIGFRIHTLLLATWQTNAIPNTITLQNLKTIPNEDPYSIFVGLKLFSSTETVQYLSQRFLLLGENCAFLANGQSLLFWLVVITLAYLVLRLTVLGDNILSPKKIYYQQNWRYRVLNMEISAISPWCQSIVQILTYRLLYYALLELKSATNSSNSSLTGTGEAILVLGFIGIMNLVVFRGIFVENSYRLRHFFQSEMKSNNEMYQLVVFICDQLWIAAHVLLSDMSSRNQLAMILVTQAVSICTILYFKPFKYIWEDIIELIQCIVIMASTFLYIKLTTQTLTYYMGTAAEEEYNSLAKLHVVSVIFVLLAGLLSIGVRILKSIVFFVVRLCSAVRRSQSNWLWEVHEKPSTKLEQEMQSMSEEEKEKLISMENDIDKYIVKELLSEKASYLRDYAEAALTGEITNMTLSNLLVKNKKYTTKLQ